MTSINPASDFPENQPRAEGSKGRVLIVDDEANARNALAELMDDAGYSVMEPTSCRRAKSAR